MNEFGAFVINPQPTKTMHPKSGFLTQLKKILVVNYMPILKQLDGVVYDITYALDYYHIVHSKCTVSLTLQRPEISPPEC